jgi:hypothetical protein
MHWGGGIYKAESLKLGGSQGIPPETLSIVLLFTVGASLVPRPSDWGRGYVGACAVRLL